MHESHHVLAAPAGVHRLVQNTEVSQYAQFYPHKMLSV